MDQVRVIAKLIWQQRFWVLCVFATCTIVVCWYLAAGDLDSRFSKRLSAIKGKFSAVQSVLGKDFHPNNEVIEEDRAQAAIQSKRVYKVWSDLYERQHAEVLHWPDGLGKEFVEEMKGRKFLDEISPDMRNIYWLFIQQRLDKLREIVKAKKTGAGRREKRFGGDRERSIGNPKLEAEEDDDYLVEWLDQKLLSERLSFSAVPTHKQIWVVQEDLWVYETLLEVIARTNRQKHATRPDNTAVREISLLQVGSSAIETSTPNGGVYIAGGGQSAGPSGPSGDQVRVGVLDSGGPVQGEGVGAEGTADAGLLENRYLGPSGEPMSGASLGAEFRQLPVHMKLTMDQRYLPQLLIECANAPLPVEVKWVRINPRKAGINGFNSSNRTLDSFPDVNLAIVEVQGVVLIYGEPNKEILSVPGVEDEETDDPPVVPPETS